MPATFKIFPCKCIAIKITFAAKTPFPFFVPVNHNRNKFNAFYALRIIDEAFCIAGFNLVPYKIGFWNYN